MYNQRLTKDQYWILTESKIETGKINVNETLFTLGNGFLGSRGVLEEGTEKSHAGTYLAGIYDSLNEEPAEIVNCPNPLKIEMTIDGVLMSNKAMKVVEHTRKLDIKKALLYRKTIFEYENKKFEFSSMRFFSISNIHTGVMCFAIKPIKGDAKISVKRIIDGNRENVMRPENTTVKYFTISEKFNNKKIQYLEVKTKGLKQTIGMADLTEYNGNEPIKSNYSSGKEISSMEFSFVAKKQKQYAFTSFISIFTSREQNDVKKACINEVIKAQKKDLNKILKNHTVKWNRIWDNCDIEIKGDKTYQFSVRFNAYQLIIASPQQDIDSSIPAKTLSGEWYKGHIFWDTDIYAFPFFNYTQPKVVKNLLMYRARRLNAARKGAKSQNFKGALWPWESAFSGADETPDTWVNFDGTIIPVHNKYREHHIAADVIYALIQYYNVSGDTKFMADHGLEMVLETARFLASRVEYNEKTRKYEINTVIGPNEFQECVNNNSYTNYMAGYVLKSAEYLYKEITKTYPKIAGRIAKKINLKENEFEKWKKIAENMVFLQNEIGLIEEFEGYFKKRDSIITKFDKNGMPIWPSDVKISDVGKTQLVKQADVILLLYLFSSEFSKETKLINFEYYSQRTIHKSSLSIPIYMIIALEIDLLDNLDRFHTLVFDSDLKDIHGNTCQGIHAASLGGAWQVIVNGFAGIRIKDHVLCINPKLPKKWEGLKFKIWFRNALFELKMTKQQTHINLLKDKSRKNRSFELEVCGKPYTISNISNEVIAEA